MSQRIVEAHGPAGAAGFFFDTEGPVHEWHSPHQRITVFENANFGTVLLLDGLVMTTALDAPYYHELLVHPALTAHPDPKHVLIIGGGDGGTASELVRYPQIERIVMAELDAQVVHVGREFFPALSQGLNDPRLELHFSEGDHFIQTTEELFDVIIIDGSDPIGPAKALFEPRFLTACAERLRPGGVFVTQSESPLYYSQTIRDLLQSVCEIYDWFGIYTGTVPSYPGALWTWTWAGKGRRPVSPRRAAPAELKVYNNGLFPQPGLAPNCIEALLP